MGQKGRTRSVRWLVSYLAASDPSGRGHRVNRGLAWIVVSTERQGLDDFTRQILHQRQEVIRSPTWNVRET